MNIEGTLKDQMCVCVAVNKSESNRIFLYQQIIIEIYVVSDIPPRGAIWTVFSGRVLRIWLGLGGGGGAGMSEPTYHCVVLFSVVFINSLVFFLSFSLVFISR